MSAVRGKTTTASTQGSFAPHSRGDAEVSLGVADESPELDAALAHWDLTTADLPGIEDAWRERFSALDEPPAESVGRAAASVLRLGDSLSDWSRVSIERTQPLTVVVEDATTEDDNEDADGVTLRFVVTDEDDVQRLLAAAGNESRMRERAALASYRQDLVEGKRPVWEVLADPYEVAVAQGEAARLAREAANLRFAAESAADFEAQYAALQNNIAEGTIPAAERWALSRAVLVRRDPALPWSEGGEITHLSALETAIALAKTTREHERVRGALKDAEALPPDSPLRQFLLAERPEQSYQTTEGKGRSKKTVVHTYRPVSDLVKEDKSAQENYSRALRRSENVQARLDKARAAHAEAAQLHADLETAAAAAREQLWSMGWPGDIADLPRA